MTAGVNTPMTVQEYGVIRENKIRGDSLGVKKGGGVGSSQRA